MTDQVKQNKPPKPVVMLVLDGWGVAPQGEGNALSRADTSNMRELTESYPSFVLSAAGQAVGLDPKKHGNTRRGNIALGMGRTYLSPLEKINTSLLDQSFFKNKVLLETVNYLKKNNGALHLAGVLSDKKNDFAADYLYNTLALAARKKLDKVYIHLFLPDQEEQAADKILSLVEDYIDELGLGQVVSLIGGRLSEEKTRDRDALSRAAGVFVGQGQSAQDIKKIIKDHYRQKGSDSSLPAIVKTRANGRPVAIAGRSDALVFFNAKPRAAGIMEAAGGLIDGIEATPAGRLVDFSGYLKPAESLFETFPLQRGLVEIMAENDYRVMLLSESEKCAGLCYFFNGGKVLPPSVCDQNIVSSPNSDDYSEQPAMASKDIADNLIKAVAGGKYDLLIAGFAALDAVGYTGNFERIAEAAEALDKAVGKIAKAVLREGGLLLITASHGWAEAAYDPATDSTNLCPSASPVPLVVAGKQLQGYKLGKEDVPGGELSAIRPSGTLMDVAPTILKLFNLQKPDQMTGKPLF